MSEKKKMLKQDKTSAEKLELAQKIATNSQKISKTYATVENALIFSLRWVSSLLNKILNNPIVSKIFALVIAIVLYTVVNVSTEDISGISQSATITDVPVEIVYNSEVYEISGIPQQVDVIVSGDMSDITVQKNKTNAKVTADLTGLTEGSYQIKLTPTNFSSRLEVNVLDYPRVDVVIKKKTTKTFTITAQYINESKMSSKCSLEDPVLSSNEVTVRASQDTLNQIAFVKALIDVTGITDELTQYVRNVTFAAFNEKGEVVDCDIFSSNATITATIEVENAKKEATIVVNPSGTLPNNLAIDSITPIDYDKVTLIGKNSVVSEISTFAIPLDISNITADTETYVTLTKPVGVSEINPTRLKLMVKVGEKTSREIVDVAIEREGENTDSFGYKSTNADEVKITVKIYGTSSNIENITAADITASVDVSTIDSAGVYDLPVTFTCTNPYVTVEMANGNGTVSITVVKQ